MSGRSNKGFTLVELLISMAVAGIVMAAIYSSYYSQQKAYVTQEQVAAMQQNLRAAMYHLERDIRMAGYDPLGTAGAGFVTSPSPPSATRLQFTKDDAGTTGTGGDGDTADANENITYEYVNTTPAPKRIERNGQPFIENIDALNFVYLDSNGAVTTTPNAIRSVQITVVARTARIDPGYTDTTVYRNLQNTTLFTPSGNDTKYRRNMLRLEVRCRNIGI